MPELTVVINLQTAIALKLSLRNLYRWTNTDAKYFHPTSTLRKINEDIARAAAMLNTDIEKYNKPLLEQSREQTTGETNGQPTENQ